ncbi:MAG: Do family serine endopeptidase [Alphaproteobacteria bacterium]|nr:Do family serine endopeptidase [Alphaproteobacteria bacterium]
MLTKVFILLLALCVVNVNSAAAQTKLLPQSQQQIQLSFAPLVKKTAPAVVNIYTKRTVSQRSIHPFARDPFFAPFFRDDFFGGRMRKQIESALGSGVILASDGLVVTNAHVIRDADEITVVLSDGREFEARLALADEPSDLALLRIDDLRGESLPYVSLKPSETLEVGDIVLAIGNPFGVGQTVTSGIVSAQGRSSLDISDFNFFIQTDAAINPGNSGGALVALDGGVVGINSAIYSRDGGSLGIGFAIPSEMVASVIAAEKAGLGGTRGVIRPWLGVTSQNLSADIADSLGLKTPHGTLINALHPASPLKKAGVKVGDVILSLNDKEIRDASEMKFRMATVPLGDKAKVTLMRQDQKLNVYVEAMAPPEDPPRDETSLSGEHALNGAVVGNLNPAVALELGLSSDAQGIVVLKVARASRAARVLSPGDLLVEINGHEINDVKDVEKALNRGSGQGLSLVIQSGGRVQRIVIR